jgi:3-oxoadipate enol-lactonase
MPDPSTGYAASGDARLYYEIAGEGAPVLLIHAGVADSRMWGPQFATVPEGFRMIRFDARGFGWSQLGQAQYSTHGDALAVLDHLEIEEPAVVVGCSMGGGTAIDLALAAPGRVRGLVLIGAWSPGFTGPDAEYEPEQWSDVVAAFKSGDLDRAADLEAEIWMVGVGRARSEVDSGLFDLVRTMDRKALETEKAREELVVPLDPPAAERMDDLEAPTLVIVGEHDLPDIRAAAIHLADRTSNQPAVLIPRAAHLPSLEQPEAFHRAFHDFLGSLS